jgi:hypothetical protein
MWMEALQEHTGKGVPAPIHHVSRSFLSFDSMFFERQGESSHERDQS